MNGVHAPSILPDEHTQARNLPDAETRAVASANPVTVALRLALGLELGTERADWVAVFAVALRERLAPLAWLRSGTVIRESAPRDVVDRWRTLAVTVDRRGRERLALLATALDALRGRGIEPLVLKGMPLSERLYGDPFVRASDVTVLYRIPVDVVEVAFEIGFILDRVFPIPRLPHASPAFPALR